VNVPLTVTPPIWVDSVPGLAVVVAFGNGLSSGAGLLLISRGGVFGQLGSDGGTEVMINLRVKWIAVSNRPLGILALA